MQGSPTREDFTGHELDAETGLHYAGARYYMAALGRFMSTDPHAASYPGWSPYHYVANNPVSITDPTGMDWAYYTTEDDDGVVSRHYYWREDIDENTVLEDGHVYAEASFEYETTDGGTLFGYDLGSHVRVDANGDVIRSTLSERFIDFVGSEQFTAGSIASGAAFTALQKAFELQVSPASYQAGANSLATRLRNAQRTLMRSSYASAGDDALRLARNAGRVSTALSGVAVLSIGTQMIVDEEYRFSRQNAADAIFAGVAFIPGGGWVVSGAYGVTVLACSGGTSGFCGGFNSLTGR